MTTDIRYSVIIPVYNSEKTLATAIDSVLRQTYPAFEIIVVDDGSVDGSAAIAQQYGHKIKYLYQPNAGVAAARNHGADHATGDWLVFLDSDDYYYPDRLKRYAELLQQDPHLDFVTGNFDYRRPDNSMIGPCMEQNELGRILLAKAGDQGFTVMEPPDFEKFVAKHFGDTHTLTVPRNRFLELNGYPTRFAVCEDVYLLVKLCAQSKRIGIVCDPQAAYVVHDGSATRSNPLRAQQQTLEAMLELKKSLKGKVDQYIGRGLQQAVRHSRLDLATVLLKQKRWRDAIGKVLPLLTENPGIRSMRDVISIMRG